MSAYICDNKTISAIAKGFEQYKTSRFEYEAENYKPSKGLGGMGFIFEVRDNEQAIGQSLLEQNYASVNYRYGEEEEVPKFEYEDVHIDEGIVYGCIRCFEYQACETPDYNTSQMHKSLLRLKDELLCRLLKKNGMKAPYGYDGLDVLER